MRKVYKQLNPLNLNLLNKPKNVLKQTKKIDRERLKDLANGFSELRQKSDGHAQECIKFFQSLVEILENFEKNESSDYFSGLIHDIPTGTYEELKILLTKFTKLLKISETDEKMYIEYYYWDI
eukprot:UN03925